MKYKMLTPKEKRARDSSMDLNEFLNGIENFERKAEVIRLSDIRRIERRDEHVF